MTYADHLVEVSYTLVMNYGMLSIVMRNEDLPIKNQHTATDVAEMQHLPKWLLLNAT